MADIFKNIVIISSISKYMLFEDFLNLLLINKISNEAISFYCNERWKMFFELLKSRKDFFEKERNFAILVYGRIFVDRFQYSSRARNIQLEFLKKAAENHRFFLVKKFMDYGLFPKTKIYPDLEFIRFLADLGLDPNDFSFHGASYMEIFCKLVLYSPPKKKSMKNLMEEFRNVLDFKQNKYPRSIICHYREADYGFFPDFIFEKYLLINGVSSYEKCDDRKKRENFFTCLSNAVYFTRYSNRKVKELYFLAFKNLGENEPDWLKTVRYIPPLQLPEVYLMFKEKLTKQYPKNPLFDGNLDYTKIRNFIKKLDKNNPFFQIFYRNGEIEILKIFFEESKYLRDEINGSEITNKRKVFLLLKYSNDKEKLEILKNNSINPYVTIKIPKKYFYLIKNNEDIDYFFELGLKTRNKPLLDYVLDVDFLYFLKYSPEIFTSFSLEYIKSRNLIKRLSFLDDYIHNYMFIDCDKDNIRCRNNWCKCCNLNKNWEFVLDFFSREKIYISKKDCIAKIFSYELDDNLKKLITFIIEHPIIKDQDLKSLIRTEALDFYIKIQK